MCSICGVLRFRDNRGLRALITAAALRVPTVQQHVWDTLPGRGDRQEECLCGPPSPTATCKGLGGLSNHCTRVWTDVKKGNQGEVRGHPALGEKMDDARLLKPAPQTQGCSTLGDDGRKEKDAVPRDKTSGQKDLLKYAKIILQPFSTAQTEWLLFWVQEIKIALCLPNRSQMRQGRWGLWPYGGLCKGISILYIKYRATSNKSRQNKENETTVRIFNKDTLRHLQIKLCIFLLNKRSTEKGTRQLTTQARQGLPRFRWLGCSLGMQETWILQRKKDLNLHPVLCRHSGHRWPTYAKPCSPRVVLLCQAVSQERQWLHLQFWQSISCG